MEEKKILVIEDDQEVLEMLTDYLTFLGYTVTPAKDGLEGIKEIKSKLYDLVVTDLTMPFVSGVGIINVLKKDHPDIPVIAITGYGHDAEELARENHADLILGKPFDIDKFKEAIIDLLSPS